jgi:twin arginine-targeting protein translocase, TatA/E family
MHEVLGLVLARLGTPEIILIVVVILILFGGRKIPELMKGIGKGVRGFKDGLKEVEDEITSDTKDSK